MEKEYKFVSKFVEGKSYNELTQEEIEKLKSGIGVKKEDKEYINFLEIDTNELKEHTNNEMANIPKEITEDKKEKIEEEGKSEKIESDENIEKTIEKEIKGVRVIQAMGKILKLEDKRIIQLSKEELKKKPFWRKGDVYYG